jgi:hypothetical protein
MEKAAQETGYDFSGPHKPTNNKDNYSLAYAEFTVPLVKAVREQQKTISDLQKTGRRINETDTESKAFSDNAGILFTLLKVVIFCKKWLSYISMNFIIIVRKTPNFLSVPE